MEKNCSTKILNGPDIDVIQYCRDYIHILDSLNDKVELITLDQQELIKSDEKLLLTKFSNRFLNFFHKSDGFEEIIAQFKQMFGSTEQMPDAKRAAQLREYLFDKTLHDPTDAKIILDGLVGFYSSPRGNLLKEKDFSDSHAFCHGALTLIPGNKAACDYIVKPERVPDTLLGGLEWHGQPHLRDDPTRVGLCPACLENLLKMRIDSHHAFLAKIRHLLASNANSPHATAAIEKEKQLTLALSTLQKDLERVVEAKSALEKIETHDNAPGQTPQTGGIDEDMEWMSILHQESIPIEGSHEDEQVENTIHLYAGDASSNSEQNDESPESGRLRRAANKKTTANRNLPDLDVSTESKNTPKSRQLTSGHQKTKLSKNTSEPPKAQGKRTRSAAQRTYQTSDAEQLKGLKRKLQGIDTFRPDKKQKRQDKEGGSNVNILKKQNELTLRVEDTAFSYPITKAQVFLFNALALVVSPEFAKSEDTRAMYHDSLSQVDLATLSHLKEMLSLAYTKKCESMGLK